MRTTIDIDNTVLDQLKERRRRDGRTLGQLVSELLATALAETGGGAQPPELTWIARPMGERVDIGDRDALQRALDDAS